MRYIAIFQVKPDGSFEPVINNEMGDFVVGNWNIKAQMNASEPANIQVWNNNNSAMLVSGGTLTFKGKKLVGEEIESSKLIEIMDGKEIFMECTDEIPEAIQKVSKMEKSANNQ